MGAQQATKMETKNTKDAEPEPTLANEPEFFEFAKCLQTSSIICSMLFYVNDSERSKCFDDQYLECRKSLSPANAALTDKLYYSD